jgi:hypothetical protein
MSDVVEEANPLLNGESSSPQPSTTTFHHVEQSNRDKLVMDAVSNLNIFPSIFSWTCIIALIIIFIDEYTDDAIPLWVIFLDLWIGHLALFALSIYCLNLVLKSLLSKNEFERQTARWHQANEKRIPLIQYLVYNIAWILGISTMFVITEVLLYLHDYSTVPAYGFLVPIYAIIIISLLSAILCR